MATKISPRVVRVKRKGYYSIIASVVHYMRDPASGKPKHEIIATFPSIRSNQLTDPNVLKNFWSAVEQEMLRLMLSQYMRADIDKILRTFSEKIPRPTLKISTPSGIKPIASKPTGLAAKYPIIVRKK